LHKALHETSNISVLLAAGCNVMASFVQRATGGLLARAQTPRVVPPAWRPSALTARTRAQVRFEPSDGHVLLTAGYDATAKLWDARDWRLVRTLAGHEGRVMGADMAPDGSGAAATVAYDRTLKLWAPEDPPLEQP